MPPPSHPFVAHLWKAGACRDCSLSAAAHAQAEDGDAAAGTPGAAAASFAATPRVNSLTRPAAVSTSVLGSVKSPPPTRHASVAAPSPSASAVPSTAEANGTGFRRPTLPPDSPSQRGSLASASGVPLRSPPPLPPAVAAAVAAASAAAAAADHSTVAASSSTATPAAVSPRSSSVAIGVGGVGGRNAGALTTVNENGDATASPTAALTSGYRSNRGSQPPPTRRPPAIPGSAAASTTSTPQRRSLAAAYAETQAQALAAAGGLIEPASPTRPVPSLVSSSSSSSTTLSSTSSSHFVTPLYTAPSSHAISRAASPPPSLARAASAQQPMRPPPPLPPSSSSASSLSSSASSSGSVSLSSSPPAAAATAALLPPPLPVSAASPSLSSSVAPVRTPPSFHRAATSPSHQQQQQQQPPQRPPPLPSAGRASQTTSSSSSSSSAGTTATAAGGGKVTPVGAASGRPASARLVDYFLVFGRGCPVIGDEFGDEWLAATAAAGAVTPAVQAAMLWSCLRFQPALQSRQRYPTTDHRDSALSGNTGSFAFPRQCRLKLVRLRDAEDTYAASFVARRPLLHRFTLTKVDGTKQYCSCLTFWERMPDTEVAGLLAEVEAACRARANNTSARPLPQDFDPKAFVTALWAALDGGTNSHAASTVTPSSPSSSSSSSSASAVYAPRCLTIVSSWPFFSLWEEFLRALYRLAHAGVGERTLRAHARPGAMGLLSSESSPSAGEQLGSAFALLTLPAPLERFIVNFVSEVPVPPPGRLQVRYVLPGATMALAGSTLSNTATAGSVALAAGGALLISRPAINQLPLCDIDWALLFRAVDGAAFVRLFTAVACEAKVLLVSQHRQLIAAVCDAICTLLYPFAWQGVYMPCLPEGPMLDFLYAPVPFLAGITTPTLAKLRADKEAPDLPEDLLLVELDAKPTVRIGPACATAAQTADGSSNSSSIATPPLPPALHSKLLAHLAQHAHVHNPSHPLVALCDQAFPFGQELDRLPLAVAQAQALEAGQDDNVNCNGTASMVNTAPSFNAGVGDTPPTTQHLTRGGSVTDIRTSDANGPSVPFLRAASATLGDRAHHASRSVSNGVTGSAPAYPSSPSSSASSSSSPSSSSSSEGHLDVEQVRMGFLGVWTTLLKSYEKYCPWGEHRSPGVDAAMQRNQNRQHSSNSNNSIGGGGSETPTPSSPTSARSLASSPTRAGSPTPGGGGGGGGGGLWFNSNAMLSASPRDWRPFLSALLKTQMFARFIDDRIVCRGDIEAWKEEQAKVAKLQQQQQQAASAATAKHPAPTSSPPPGHASLLSPSRANTVVSQSGSRGSKLFSSPLHPVAPSGGAHLPEDSGSDDDLSGETLDSVDAEAGLSRSTAMRSSLPLPPPGRSSVAGHKRHGSFVVETSPAIVPAATAASSAVTSSSSSLHEVLPLCTTLPPPSLVSDSLDAHDPTAPPVLASILFFDESVLASRNRKRAAAMRSRVGMGATTFPTPFLHDKSTAATRVVEAPLPSTEGLPPNKCSGDGGAQMAGFSFPAVRFNAALDGRPASVFPVFPLLDPSLYGTPRPVATFALPTWSPPIHEMEVEVGAVDMPVYDEQESVVQLFPNEVSAADSASSSTSLSPANKPRLPSHRPPPLPSTATTPTASSSTGSRPRVGGTDADADAGGSEHVSPSSPSSSSSSGHIITDAAVHRGRESLRSATVIQGTPASNRIVAGQRGSFADFRRKKGMGSNITALATILSFESFQERAANASGSGNGSGSGGHRVSLAGKRASTATAPAALSSSSSSAGAAAAASPIGNTKLHKWMEKERIKQEQLRAKEAAEERERERRRQQMQARTSLSSASSQPHPFLLPGSSSSVAASGVSSVESTPGASRRGSLAGGAFSFAPSAAELASHPALSGGATVSGGGHSLTPKGMSSPSKGAPVGPRFSTMKRASLTPVVGPPPVPISHTSANGMSMGGSGSAHSQPHSPQPPPLSPSANGAPGATRTPPHPARKPPPRPDAVPATSLASSAASHASLPSQPQPPPPFPGSTSATAPTMSGSFPAARIVKPPPPLSAVLDPQQQQQQQQRTSQQQQQ